MMNFSKWLETFKPEIILGWQVYIDNSACSSCSMPKYGDPQKGEINPVPNIAKDEQLIRKALAGLQSIGVHAKIPVRIYYAEDGDEIIAASYSGERLEKPSVYIKRPVRANSQELLHVIPHEMARVMFNTLPKKNQIRVRELAMSHPHLSEQPQAKFVHGDKKHWRNGNEWFADVITKMSQGKLQGEPIRSELMSLIAN